MPTFSVLILVETFKIGSSISLIRTEFKVKKTTFFIAFCCSKSRSVYFLTSRFIIYKNFTEAEKNLT